MNNRQWIVSDHAVALVVKRYAKRVGLQASSFSGHSLRAGLRHELREGRGAGTENHANDRPQKHLDGAQIRTAGECVHRQCGVGFGVVNTVRLKPPRSIVLRALSDKTGLGMFIYAARQIQKNTGEKVHFCATLNEAFSLGKLVDVKVVRFAGGLHSHLEPELLAAEQLRIDEICFPKRKSFTWRNVWPFARAA